MAHAPDLTAQPDLANRLADRRLLLRAGGGVFFWLATALGAHVAVPLPPDGVPMTLQTLAVVLAALCLGPKVGTLAMVGYALAGMAGVPMFADGSVGLAVILGQTGGYIVGFALCQPVVARIVRRPDGTVRGWGGLVLAVLAGHAVIFAVGVPWLAVVRGYSLWRAVEGGMLPFLPGMVVKAAIAVLIGRLVAPWCARKVW